MYVPDRSKQRTKPDSMADVVTHNLEYVCNMTMLQHNDNLHLNNIYPKVKDFQELPLLNTSKSTSNTITSNINITSSNSAICWSNSREKIADEMTNNLSPLHMNNIQTNRNRFVAALEVILRFLLPLANGVARSIKGICDVRFLAALQKITVSRQILTNLFALAANSISMSLSSVQVSQRIELLLQLMKIRKSSEGLENLPDTPTHTTATLNYSPLFRDIFPEQPAAKCCTLNVLAEPPPGMPIRADVVFIHGLHGSQVNTWKQGMWEKDRRPEEFERPPQLPLRPPKRPRHSRTSAIRPPHKRKRARLHFAMKDCDQQLSQNLDEYELNEYDAADIQVCADSDYRLSTFRLRMNDHGRQLQAEFNSRCKVIPDATTTNRNNVSDLFGDQQFSGYETRKSFTSLKPSPNDPGYSKCWPGDWLPLDCPGVRVMALNYTTDQYLWRPLWKKKEQRTNLVQRSREMAELLVEHRVGYGHPIIWVGHSKGGLFIKQIIVDAWESGRPATVPFWRSARGVFFYSVPHRGSHLASIKAPLLSRSVELIDIEQNSKYLIDLHRRFVCLYQLGHLKIEVFSFVETALTLMSVLYLRIVGADSADPGIGDVCGIHLDHREICKPRSRECILYKELIKMIEKVC